jgi:hypothetical protein
MEDGGTRGNVSNAEAGTFVLKQGESLSLSADMYSETTNFPVRFRPESAPPPFFSNGGGAIVTSPVQSATLIRW